MGNAKAPRRQQATKLALQNNSGKLCEYLEVSTEVRKLMEEARHSKLAEFTDLEHNPGSAHTCPTIKALSVHNGRTFITNQGKANAIMKINAALNKLNVSRTERNHIRQLKEVLRSPTMDEVCC